LEDDNTHTTVIAGNTHRIFNEKYGNNSRAVGIRVIVYITLGQTEPTVPIIVDMI
jgi:hypothetical protein